MAQEERPGEAGVLGLRPAGQEELVGVRTPCAQRSGRPSLLHRKSCHVGVFWFKNSWWGQGIPEGKRLKKKSGNGEGERELLSKSFYVKIKLKKKKERKKTESLKWFWGSKDELKGG